MLVSPADTESAVLWHLRTPLTVPPGKDGARQPRTWQTAREQVIHMEVSSFASQSKAQFV